MRNRTKIIATIGPASSSTDVLRSMIRAGVNVCRINFSHGNHESHRQIIDNVRKLDKELNTHTAILSDLQGPKLRIGEVAGEGVFLEEGAEVTISVDEAISTKEAIHITYPEFARDVKAGDAVLIDDGKILLEVLKSDKTREVIAKVVQGGMLSSHKGVNLPNTGISLPCLTEKDYLDLEFALENNIPWIALSFVRSASDIIELKNVIAKRKAKSKVVAKIEKPQAIRQIDDIIKEADAVMVARGDLGVEIPLQDVPILQKEIVAKCQKAAKPVIIATQMMESMISSITPTRAEVSDVANAVTDGADAVMLSAETSIGKHPVEVIETISKIVAKAETFEGIYNKEFPPEHKNDRYITDSVCYSACRISDRVGARAIITNSFSGYTGFKIASCRPKACIFVFTTNLKILSMLNLIWGVQGFYYDQFVSTDHTIADIKYLLKKEGYLSEGDLVININSVPITKKGMANMLKLSHVD